MFDQARWHEFETCLTAALRRWDPAAKLAPEDCECTVILRGRTVRVRYLALARISANDVNPDGLLDGWWSTWNAALNGDPDLPSWEQAAPMLRMQLFSDDTDIPRYVLQREPAPGLPMVIILHRSGRKPRAVTFAECDVWGVSEETVLARATSNTIEIAQGSHRTFSIGPVTYTHTEDEYGAVRLLLELQEQHTAPGTFLALITHHEWLTLPAAKFRTHVSDLLFTGQRYTPDGSMPSLYWSLGETLHHIPPDVGSSPAGFVFPPELTELIGSSVPVWRR